MVYAKLREGLGGRLELIISGASPLPLELGRFFLNAGFPLFEGYGLTEASPVIAVNYPGRSRLGTVGPVFPGVEVRIAEDGEVLARGRNVMRGYHNNKQATRETLDTKGFLHTGDLGSLDEDGFLTITGRKKELFKKSTGEYVAPVPIEQRLSSSPYIDTAMVVADQRKFPSALIFPDMVKAAELQRSSGKEGMKLEEFLYQEEFQKHIREVIEETNRHLHHTEEVQAFQVVPKTLSVENGELTPTLKLRRHKVEEKYWETIERIYSTN
jgi:long-chain acyl-CoA synthetase